MQILLTGAAGFIGSHLTEALLRAGHQVVGMDNFDDFYDPAIKRAQVLPALANLGFTLVEADIRDKAALDRIFESYAPELVIHLAARAGVRPSLSQPALYYDVNLMGTLTLLEAMKRHGISRMIMASSSSVYGNNKKIPFSESDPVDHPVSPYAASKKAAELLCHTYSHLYGFDVFCMRFFTVYGPRQRPEMAIHQFVRKILEGRPITLYGDGSSRRDYTYIDDIIQGLLHSIPALRGYEIINLGESQTYSLIETIRLIESVTGRQAILDWQPMQAGDVEATCADISKAQRLIGYRPTFSLQAGLERFVEWIQHEQITAHVSKQTP